MEAVGCLSSRDLSGCDQVRICLWLQEEVVRLAVMKNGTIGA